MSLNKKLKRFFNVKKAVLIMLAFPFLSTTTAQTINTVEPGDGTLANAISSAKSGDVFQLKAGGVYTITSTSTFGKISFPITVQVEPHATEKAILQLGEGASTSKKYYFFEINDGAELTLKGLEIHGLLDNNVVAASMILFDARPNPSEARIGNFVFEDCIFHDFKDNIVHGMKDAYARGLIQDSVYINNVTVFNAKHFLQYKHVSLHHLEMSNSTIYDLQGMALKIGKIGYRCVLESPGKPYVPVTDETITPTGFIDHCTLNNLGDIHGHIQIDEAYHRLNISNCIIANQQEYKQPPVYLNDAVIDSAVFISNTCFWKTAGFNNTNKSVYILQNNIEKDPEFQSTEEANFSLPEGSELLTFADDNSTVGDPKWEFYTTEINEIISSRDLLLNCFPNPFKNILNIEFSLVNENSVSIKIFNIFGVEVSNLLESTEISGKHNLIWDAQNMKPGIYFCVIKVGNIQKTKKIRLHKN